MKPETAIASWKQWRGKLTGKPTIVCQLDDGRSNQSYLLDSNGTRMVLRLNSQHRFLPDTNRYAEAEIWQAASDRNIAPPLLFADNHGGFLVSTFIETNISSRSQEHHAVIEQVLNLMAQCHSLDVPAPTLDYAKHIEHYWNLIRQSGKSPANTLLCQRGPMRETLDSLLKMNTRRGLCHNDPVKANFVGIPEKLYLIDWEYAARGLVIMDYAALAVEWGISDEPIQEHAGIEAESLGMAKQLYGYLCALWEVISA